MIEHVAVVVLGLAFVVEKAGSFFVLRAAARERRELYSRIQAGTLADYSTHHRVGLDESSPHMGGTVDVEELTALSDELGEEAFVEAQAGFNSLMG